MALTTLQLSMLAPRIKPGARIAAMGYPDLIAPLDMIEALCGDNFGKLEYREDSAKICKWHGLDERRIPDSRSFFGLLGAELNVYDIVETRGGEIIEDLNVRWYNEGEWEIERCWYDFVLDVGTLEHCFNIGQAALNMACMLKAGGTIHHGNPYNMGNHGFYGLNPTWYADFYGQPGFKLHYCKMMEPRTDDEPTQPPLTKRFSCDRAEVGIFAVAERTAILPIEFPMQTKYKSLIPAAGARAKEIAHG